MSRLDAFGSLVIHAAMSCGVYFVITGTIDAMLAACLVGMLSGWLRAFFDMGAAS